MTQEAVERVARAISADNRIDGCCGWDLCVPRITDGICDCTDAARAAIAAMQPSSGEWTEADVVNCIGGWALNFKRGVGVHSRREFEVKIRQVLRQYVSPAPPEDSNETG